ncbi:hypothetical protein ACS0TY_019377 [Phlomoides rotata]
MMSMANNQIAMAARCRQCRRWHLSVILIWHILQMQMWLHSLFHSCNLEWLLSKKGQSGSSKARQVVSPSNLGVSTSASLPNNSGSISTQQFSMQGRDIHLPPRQPTLLGHGMPPMHPSQSSGNLNQGVDSSLGKCSATGPETSQAQNARQLNRSPSQSATPSNEVGVSSLSTSQGAPAPQMRQSLVGFTKQQLLVLKAQILAFRRLKKGDGILPHELLQNIAPPSLDSQMQHVLPPPATAVKDRSAGEIVYEHSEHMEPCEKGLPVVKSVARVSNLKEEGSGDYRAATFTVNM